MVKKGERACESLCSKGGYICQAGAKAACVISERGEHAAQRAGQAKGTLFMIDLFL